MANLITPSSNTYGEAEESEMEDSEDFPQPRPPSQQYSITETKPKYSQMSNLNLDSVLQEKDVSICRLQHEVFDWEKTNAKWRKRYQKIKRMYKKKCMEFEESLAYLDIEGEQNKILEQKTSELQSRVDNEIRLIKAECEDIIIERENECRDEIALLSETIEDKDEEIQRYKVAYSELEDETTSLIKNFRAQLLAKDSELQMIQEHFKSADDDKMSEKISKISELERKLMNQNMKHEEEQIHMREQIEKYQSLLKEKDMENENKLLDTNANYRKKETVSRSEQFRIKKEQEVKFVYNSVASNRFTSKRSKQQGQREQQIKRRN